MASTSYLHSGTGLVVGDGLERHVRDMLRNTENRVARAIVPTVERVADDGERIVPVRTGRLKESVGSFVKVGEDEVRAGVRMGDARAPYAYQVRFASGLTKREQAYKRTGKLQFAIASPHARKSVFQVALRRPALAAFDELEREATAAIMSPAGHGGVGHG